jgi:hypothetical protein
MKPLGDPITHFWNVQRMARATGTDLVAAHDTGALSSEDWAGMVTRCRGCEWAEGCQEWLPEHTDGTAKAPKGCVNRRIFDALKV